MFTNYPMYSSPHPFPAMDIAGICMRGQGHFDMSAFGPVEYGDGKSYQDQ
jgi:hypothetical protein